MINIKKGNGLTLRQVDKVATAPAAVVAGQLVKLTSTDGAVFTAALEGGSGSSTAAHLIGFSLSNVTDSDVLASGKIGVLLLDGSSVIETDQTEAAITIANYAIGAPLYASASTAGALSTTSTTTRVIGYVEGIRSIPGTPSGTTLTQSWIDVNSNTISGSQAAGSLQSSTTVLGVKLAV